MDFRSTVIYNGKFIIILGNKYARMCYKMRREDTIEVIYLLNEAVGEYFDIIDQDYFIICEGAKHFKDIIVHGYGTQDKPYEVIMPRLQDGDSIVKQFTNKEEFLDYIENDLKKEMVLYQI